MHLLVLVSLLSRRAYREHRRVRISILKKAVLCFEQGQLQMFQRNSEFPCDSLRFMNLYEGYE